MQQHNIEKSINETLNSFDGAARAEANPFLLTRIFARMQNQTAVQNIWTRTGSFLSRPAVALAGLLIVIILNTMIIMQSTGSENNAVQGATVKDEFAINVISIYDIENQEP